MDCQTIPCPDLLDVSWCILMYLYGKIPLSRNLWTVQRSSFWQAMQHAMAARACSTSAKCIRTCLECSVRHAWHIGLTHARDARQCSWCKGHTQLVVFKTHQAQERLACVCVCQSFLRLSRPCFRRPIVDIVWSCSPWENACDSVKINQGTLQACKWLLSGQPANGEYAIKINKVWKIFRCP